MPRLLATFVGRLSVVVAVASAAIACSGSPADDADSELSSVTAANCVKAQPWKENTAYKVGDIVQFKGRTFKCIQAHTSLSVWTPDIVPALFAEVSCTATPPVATGNKPNPAPTTPPAPAAPPPPPPPKSPPPKSGGGAANATEYAPYYFAFSWGSPAFPFTSLVDLHNKSGLNSVTLAFVLSSSGCATTRDVQNNQSDVNAFRAAGGRVKASFGGALGTYLENACPDSASLAQAIASFVTSTGITDLDFDVEQPGAVTKDINAKRAAALKAVQDATGINVAFTVPAVPRDKNGTPGGMTTASVDVVASAVRVGVRISHVNLMTMDYGAFFSAGRAMGDLAVSALTDANAQLRNIVPGLTEAQAFAMLGATPMIGHNDVQTEVFTLADAQTLTNFAKQVKLGLVSFWAINRDQVGNGGIDSFSEVNIHNFDFNNIFKTVQQ